MMLSLGRVTAVAERNRSLVSYDIVLQIFPEDRLDNQRNLNHSLIQLDSFKTFICHAGLKVLK